MKVLLISANTEPLNMPIVPMGLGCVAEAARRAGHAIELLDLMRKDDPRGLVRAAVTGFDPRVVAVSVRNIDDQNMDSTRFLLEPVRGLVALIKSISDAPVVMGGAGYSIFPDAALDYTGADMGIEGEGELAFVELLSRLEAGGGRDGVPGLHLAGRGLVTPREDCPPLCDLPDPAMWPVSLAEDPEVWFPVQTRRGCPMDCSYCSTATIEGRRIRKREIGRFVASLAQYANAGFRRVYFADNTFNLPPAYARDLCRALGESGVDVKWRCIVYPDRLDSELARLMKQAGCVGVSLGFETGSEITLSSFNKKFGKDDIRRVNDCLADAGIARMGFLLLGGPAETRATVEESLSFADSLELDMGKACLGIRIYPGTALAQAARREGMIREDDNLLFPRFYMKPGLEPWLRERVAEWLASRPRWRV